MRLFFFLIFVGFAVTNHLIAQPVAFPQLTLKAPTNNWYQRDSVSSFLDIKRDTLIILPQQSHLPLNFYSTHLGAACKMELQLEKQTKLPIRIRLGSKEQVDYLEGKFSRNR